MWIVIHIGLWWISLNHYLHTCISKRVQIVNYTRLAFLWHVIYSASQKKRNREVLMFYHNLITTIINEWYIFGKLRVSSFSWCYSEDAYFTHEWLKAIWRKETKKTFGGRYLNFEEKLTFLESWVSALSYDTSIRKNERGITKFCLFKVVLAFP